ncbi:MFS transporter [Nocardioides mangrovicus]|uniref:MFS transporter n=1 Tax=Nocardioides mangrovicus TaxID=2478913 RepID=UPI001314DD42|nr:MFS transporter [Nocardioides mangrovicus]
MLDRLGFPDVRRHRRFVAAFGIDALGSGVWLPMSVLYFVAVTPQSLARIGLALTIANVVTIPFALLVGQLIDRYDAKRVLQVGNLVQALGFAAYPLAHSWWSIALVVTVPCLGRTMFWGSYSALVAAVSEPGERERWFGFLGALRNSGFAVGGLVAGAVITADHPELFHAVALLNAASYLLSFVLLVPPLPDRGVAAEKAPASPHGFAEVLGDRGYRWLIGANAGYALGSMALNVVMPVYIVEVLGLPGWVSAGVYVLNTVLIGVLQGIVVRRMTGALRWRVVSLAAVFMAISFVLLYGAGELARWLSILVVLVAAVVYTTGEMVGGPVLSTLAAESPPEHLRGRYLATFQLSWNGAGALAPVLYLWLLGIDRLAVWSALVVVVLLGALCAARMRRWLTLADLPVVNRIVLPASS